MRIALLATVVIACALSACASKPATPQLVNISGMIPITDVKMANTHAYETPTFDRSKYHGMIIDPADLYRGPDADFGSTSVADQEMIAAKLTSEFRRVLTAAGFNVVTTPAPGVVRIHMTLMGINASHPVLSTALRLTPVGLVMSAGHTVLQKPASFVGSINIAAVVYDEGTGQVLVAAQSVVYPEAMDLTSGLTPLRAAELSTTRAADGFRDYLLRKRAGG
jgi:Protein of unknown function (DUF3313)